MTLESSLYPYYVAPRSLKQLHVTFSLQFSALVGQVPILEFWTSSQICSMKILALLLLAVAGVMVLSEAFLCSPRKA